MPETIYFWPLMLRLLKQIPWMVWAVALIVGAIVWWPASQTAPAATSTMSDLSEESRRKVEAFLEPEPAIAPAVPPAPVPVSPLSRAPNGEAWPYTADYVPGYELGAAGGYSTLTIDNTSNDYDVYVKLTWADAPPGSALRHVYIPGRASFTMEDVEAGAYEVRYKNLSSGLVAKTEQFALSEEHSSDGIRYSQVTFTLYTVQHGNTQMKFMPADQF